MPTETRHLFGMRLVLVFLFLIGMVGATPAEPVLAATVMVTNTSDTGPGSLRDAIFNAASGDTITFGPWLAGQTILLASDLIINKDLTIDGSGLSPQIMISGGNIAHLVIQNPTIPPTVTISDLTISDGYTSGNGGGIDAGFGNLTLINTTLRNNHALGGGGAVSAMGLTVRNTAIYFNQAAEGGAIYLAGNSVFISTIVNSTIAHNQADSGGAISLHGSLQVAVFTSTFAGNNASQGSEISEIGIGTLILSNSVLACIPASNSCILQTGNSPISSMNSFIGTGELTEFGLTELADNGGPTKTMALLPESPLIDAGEDLVCASAPVNHLDQRGMTRPQGSHCDIGAFEYRHLIHHVSSAATGANDGASWGDAFTNLQAALSASLYGDEIWIAAGTYKPTAGTDRNSSFTLRNGVAVYGGFAGTETLLAQRNPGTRTKDTILSGDIGIPDDNSDNCYHVVIASDTNNSAILDGVTITGGNANSVNEVYGGGVYNDHGSPTVRNVTFSSNHAIHGGGMYNQGGRPALTNITFASNSAPSGHGGGMYNIVSNPNLTNVTFSGNIAARGGGMYNTASSPNLINVTFSANQGTQNGGGMFNYSDSRPTLTNVILWDDSSEIYNDSSTPTISYSVVQGSGGSGSLWDTDLGTENGGNLDVNPQLGSLADNGGDTQTMALGKGSPARDAGNDTNCPATDQRGVPRPQGSHCDIGAYEYQKKKGTDTTGVFRPSNGLLFLKNSNTTGFADIAINYGIPGDYPVVGDWDGDGTVTIGIYRNGSFYLRNSNTIGFADIVFPFGMPGDQPLAGDWNGDGTDTIAVYRPSTGAFYLRNSNSVGAADVSFFLGNVGDVGIAGDWDGDGFDTTGVFRPSNGIIFLKNTNMTGFADIALNYGIPGDKPLTGDWNSDGIDTIAVYRNGIFYLRNSNTVGFADIVFGLGYPGDMPIAGNWNGQP